jgi:hypothetical protein
MSIYPENWPRCPYCGDYALDGHLTCGRVACDEREVSDRKNEEWRRWEHTTMTPDRMDGHELECALAAYASLIERAERNHGSSSAQASQLRREYRSIAR